MLLQIHWDVDPTLFELGPLAPRWYGLLFALGFLIGFYLMQRVFQREDKPVQDLDFLLLYLLGGTVIGARLGHVLFYAPGYYLLRPVEIIAIWEGGLASHGGLIGVLLAIWLYCRRREDQPFVWLLDRLSAPVALTGALIRLGNLFNSEILGVPTDLPWGVVFERAARLRDDIEAVPLHPVQVYESISYALIASILWVLYRRYGEDTPRGLLVGLFMTLIFGARIVLETVKREQAHFDVGLPLSMGQLLSIPAVLFGLWLLWRAYQTSSESAAAPS
ncbi:MAG: prolipoprotein diacylglyceryl transferase [Salinibacter sp.]